VLEVLLMAVQVLVAVLKTVVWLVSEVFAGVLKPPLMRKDTPSLSATPIPKAVGVVTKLFLCVTLVHVGVDSAKLFDVSRDHVSDTMFSDLSLPP
jgi:hypothetical protein